MFLRKKPNSTTGFAVDQVPAVRNAVGDRLILIVATWDQSMRQTSWQ